VASAPTARPDLDLSRVYRESWGSVLSALIADLNDFELAEDALQEAFASAVRAWADKPPKSPKAWLFTAAKRKAIDQIRRRNTQRDKVDDVREAEELRSVDDEHGFVDHRLRLAFTCCHPALAPQAQVALTLRTVCGLDTDEIARAFLVEPSTMAQRLVRAKRKIKQAKIPYRVPPPERLPERLGALLSVVYLVFNEGYAATAEDSYLRPALCDEAIRLGMVLVELMPKEPEVLGLLALMRLVHARRDARLDEDGRLVLLDRQDRRRWNHDEIAEGLEMEQVALRKGAAGPYQLQAAIAAVHSEAEAAEQTDWNQVVALYNVLMTMRGTPVVALNRGVAVAMASGPAAGLEVIEGLEEHLDKYHLFHSARANLLERLERDGEALDAWRRALDLAPNPVEQAYLRERIAGVSP